MSPSRDAPDPLREPQMGGFAPAGCCEGRTCVARQMHEGPKFLIETHYFT
jgi:hypothetical protein